MGGNSGPAAAAVQTPRTCSIGGMQLVHGCSNVHPRPRTSLRAKGQGLQLRCCKVWVGALIAAAAADACCCCCRRAGLQLLLMLLLLVAAAACLHKGGSARAERGKAAAAHGSGPPTAPPQLVGLWRGQRCMRWPACPCCCSCAGGLQLGLVRGGRADELRGGLPAGAPKGTPAAAEQQQAL